MSDRAAATAHKVRDGVDRARDELAGAAETMAAKLDVPGKAESIAGTVSENVRHGSKRVSLLVLAGLAVAAVLAALARRPR